jgi:hypothetical protein
VRRRASGSACASSSEKRRRWCSSARTFMRRVRGRRRRIRGATTSARTRPIAAAAAVNGTTTKRRRLVHSPRTGSVSLTWSATSGSGCRIAIATITMELPPMVPRGPLVTAVAVWFAAVPGATFLPCDILLSVIPCHLDHRPLSTPKAEIRDILPAITIAGAGVPFIECQLELWTPQTVRR